jgi:CubicO group peptidase (beta-lactamase class C family)
LTKSFAAAAILMLRDEGRLNLAQSPRNFVPELGSDWDGTSLFQLLSMQSGLGEDFGGSWAEQHLPLSNPEISQRFAVPLIRAALPGTQYFYSNFGYMVLGRVISRASGQDARAFIAQRLLDPLGMTSTSWSVPGANAACGYRRGENRFEKESLLSGCNDGAVFGGLWSSLPDMAHWVDFLASAHGSDGERYEQILSGTSRLEMQRAVALRPIAPVDEPNKPPVCLGYGFGLVNQPSRFEWTVGHGGAVPGFGCHMRWSPNTGIGLVAFANLRYADLSEGCERILAAATEKAPSRVAPIHPKVAARASALLDLVSEWNLAVAEELFAFNFFVDYPREEVAKQFKELREEFGGQLADAQIVQLGGLSAKIMISDSAIMTFTVSSFEPGHVQELIF